MKSSIRNFALAASLIAITLSATATNAAALTRKAGGAPLKYMTTSTVSSGSSAAEIIRGIIMAVDSYLWLHP